MCLPLTEQISPRDIHQFLHLVAKGKQTEAECLLITATNYIQVFLRTPGLFTDYSGRTFDSTAYEYAYWAKDTYMCQMLEKYMSNETKVVLFARIDEMKRIDPMTDQPSGLAYRQYGIEKRSARRGS